jgi:hypothetical protein
MWDGAWPQRGPNRIEYIILWNFNAYGFYSSWDRKLGPYYPFIRGYGWYTQGVGVAVFDLNYDPNKNLQSRSRIHICMDGQSCWRK